ncbi:asparagine synthase (glutamine-hydrolysing) [Tistlia consotensis]|uniref:asparagine synthase (glutamine-hydrolyzing) n=1 Tax=Tistlia consotensis USBA 355 TaxID=560819 RepID=A0A1Y6B5N8_9PROT|nr:asparagine synthase (glutamine-hydrolyzing) [Tistlia consotensis]SME93600.1 asparagine synthase (glutamine-hydrolysing) [Tistlia consotensis USBA 355]SNR28723.1 asparagine synthase (glutamine-hydrolysing) [Tistlia consotensis]
MCGIAGLFSAGGAREAELRGRVEAMTAALAHRGPDGQDLWLQPEAGLGFGHRRLAIIDLSDAGRQPMVSEDGRWVLTYNGEIYNHLVLRRELEAEGARFRGHCDAEVLLEACAHWGVRRTAERLNGIFACALWDRRERRLYLVRDQLGVKPLYWTLQDGVLRFGSELKALRADPGFEPALDRPALAAYLRFAYLPAPHTAYAGVRKLLPGHILSVAGGEEPRLECYWDALAIAEAGQRRPMTLSRHEAVDRLEVLLKDAVAGQTMADVPLGAFLSGGVDSSTVVALMQAATGRPARTFTIGFSEAGFDEAPHARAVARHLGSEHTELYVQAEDALAVVPELPRLYDEPFADPSQIPTFLVSALTRQSVTVALSGDGGDELFAGYNRHLWGRRIGRWPLPLRQAAAGALGSLPNALWQRAGGQAADRVRKLTRALSAPDLQELYRRTVSQWDDPAALLGLPAGAEAPSLLDASDLAERFPDPLARMQLLDLTTYLPGDVLAKVDRASMAVGLEVRVPLLDARVVEFAWALAPRFKLRGGRGKWLLRQVLRRHLPARLIERPKQGFSVPIGGWLRGPLRDWAEALLDERRLAGEGLLDPAPVRALWTDHLAGRVEGQYPLWTALMLQAWREAWS